MLLGGWLLLVGLGSFSAYLGAFAFFVVVAGGGGWVEVLCSEGCSTEGKGCGFVHYVEDVVWKVGR